MKKLISKILQNILLFVVAFFCINMGDGGKKTGAIEPAFIPLEEKEESFVGKIYDDNNIIEVKDISFTGHTRIGGVRKEDDDSVNRLDLSRIKELTIVKPNYVSKKYSDKEFILANAISISGTAIEGLLIPRQVVICAIETSTQMEKSWFLYKINKIEILKKETWKAPEISQHEEAEKPKTVTEKVSSGIKKVIDTISY